MFHVEGNAMDVNGTIASPATVASTSGCKRWDREMDA